MSLLGGAGSLTGDIWSTGAFSFESPLKDLLDSNDYTLEQLLAEDELLQEVRGLHPTLIDYFAQEQNLTKLIRYITLPQKDTSTTSSTEETGATGENGSALNGQKETGAQRVTRQLEKRKSGDKSTSPEEDPEFRHVRFPYMACEIICCEVEGIINTLVDGLVKEDETQSKGEIVTNDPEEDVEVVDRKAVRLLDLFFDVLYDTPAGQLDDYRAGYFDKILSILFRKRSQELSDYINRGGYRGQQSLMEAMMKHLYSHSIMQICQRLLLPPRPTPKQTAEVEEDGEKPAGDGEDEDGIGGGQDILSGEEDEDDPNGINIKRDWSKSGVAIEMLLQRLINPESLLEADAQVSPVSAVDTNQSIEEQRLSLSLNASDVLITVIQNSMLSSQTMLSLTSIETLARLTTAATKLEEGESFSAHESLLTSAMNVVESLILQLGGYGAVGTMAILEPSEEQGEAVASEMEGGQPPPMNPDSDHLIADLESLLEILPTMLKGFSDLLRHPSTKEWKSAVQFSKDEPVQLLGTSRLRIVRVLESLVLLGDPSIDSRLVQSDCLLICLDLFWEFQWCSMLHQSVANLLVHVFEGQNPRFEIQEYFIVKCNLIRRLMDSFIEVTDPRVHNVVMDMDNVLEVGETKQDSTSADALPVSEDDIDAAIEKQEDEENATESKAEIKASEVENVDLVSTEAVDQESRGPSSVGGVTAPAQSFRFGYMGHVIIICQALVQACANEWASDQGEEITSQQQSEAGTSELQSESDGPPGDSTSKTAYPPLLIAELVNNHELTERWQEFVISTLASEIAVQSTPLGGLNAQPSDPLQAHRPDALGRRPGLADDGDIGDDALAPPPPRGMMGTEENILGADDFGLAESVMARLNLNTRPLDDDRSGGSEGDFSGSGDSGDSQRSYNSGETNNSREGYLFDDPLGKAGGSLGIELGKLTQYKPGDSPQKSTDDNDDDSSNASSSDEEPPREDDDDEDEEDADPPVMDLFAGNFNHPASPGDDKPDTPSEAFEFANFDAAFDGDAAADAFGDFESAQVSTSSGGEPAATPNQDSEDIFGGSGSASLLDKLDEFPPETETAVQEAEPKPADDEEANVNEADEDPAKDAEEPEEAPLKTPEETIAAPSTEEIPVS